MELPIRGFSAAVDSQTAEKAVIPKKHTPQNRPERQAFGVRTGTGDRKPRETR